MRSSDTLSNTFRASRMLVRAWSVLHIRSDGRTEPHQLTPFAVVDGTDITYPPEQGSLDVG